MSRQSSDRTLKAQNLKEKALKGTPGRRKVQGNVGIAANASQQSNNLLKRPSLAIDVDAPQTVDAPYQQLTDLHNENTILLRYIQSQMNLAITNASEIQNNLAFQFISDKSPGNESTSKK